MMSKEIFISDSLHAYLKDRQKLESLNYQREPRAMSAILEADIRELDELRAQIQARDLKRQYVPVKPIVEWSEGRRGPYARYKKRVIEHVADSQPIAQVEDILA